MILEMKLCLFFILTTFMSSDDITSGLASAVFVCFADCQNKKTVVKCLIALSLALLCTGRKRERRYIWIGRFETGTD